MDTYTHTDRHTQARTHLLPEAVPRKPLAMGIHGTIQLVIACRGTCQLFSWNWKMECTDELDVVVHAKYWGGLRQEIYKFKACLSKLAIIHLTIKSKQ